MKTQQLLAEQFERFYGVARISLTGVTAAESVVQPAGGGNCLNWIVGHLVNVHNALMGLIGVEPVWADPQLARAGFEPITGPENAIDWDTLLGKLFASEERCIAAIRALSDTALAEPMTDPFGKRSTRAGLLNLLAFHQAYHAGQLGTARRAAGLPGVIKGPGQASN